MRAFEFNVSGPNQYMTVDNPDHGLNPPECMTVEALCELLGNGQEPTIFSLPATETWEPPFVAWRLGCHGQERIPEFQVTIEGDDKPTTARSRNPVPQHGLVHLAGSYDGSVVKLYVNGKLEAEVEKQGKLLRSIQRPTLGARSSTDHGGLFVGRLYELRFWKIARPADEINQWKDKSLPLPAPSGLGGLWKSEPGLVSNQATDLLNRGFSRTEISLLSFVASYAHAYLLFASGTLTSTAQEQFGEPIHGVLIVKAGDGYVVIYEPFPSHLVTALGGSPEKWDGGGLLFVQDWSKLTVADVLQIVTGNAVKVCHRSGEGAGNLKIPKDREDAVAESVNPKLSQAGMSPPEIQIVVENRSADDAHPGGRLRIISPVVALKDAPARAFSWLFVDVWFGELSWGPFPKCG